MKKVLLFRDAHEAVAHAVKIDIGRGIDLSALRSVDWQALQPQIEVDLAQMLALGQPRRAQRTAWHGAWATAAEDRTAPREDQHRQSHTARSRKLHAACTDGQKTQCSSNAMADATPVATLRSGMTLALAAKGGRNIAMHTTVATRAGVNAVNARCSVLSFLGCSGAKGQLPK